MHFVEITLRFWYGTMKSVSKSSIFFVSAHKATNVLNWSGTLNSLYRSLEARNSSIPIVALDGAWLSKIAKQINRALFFLGFTFDIQLTTPYAVCAGLLISARLVFLPKGPIVAVAASNYVPFLITRRQIVYISDATFRAAARLYPEMKTLPPWLSKQCDRHEALTLRKADFIILPSKWASDSAKLEYGTNPEKLFELPFGANIAREVIEKHYVPKSINANTVQLLFASADWKRKGGEKAIEICSALRATGVNAHLTVVGNAPEHVKRLEFVKFKGFLRKSDPDQLVEICRAYQEAHFLLLPTQADASPIVFAEAQAFGVPPITHEVGGTASSIEHGNTGLLFPLGASPVLFTEGILPYLRNPALYNLMSQKCRRWYFDNAQWSRWSELIFRLCELRDEKQ
jgi:glycosyltransferase involved in cell wall biosynthesis